MWSLLDIAPSLKWLEIGKAEQLLEEDNGVWDIAHIRRNVHSELEAFILSSQFAFEDRCLSSLEAYFPNLFLIGPMEFWNGHISLDCLSSFSFQHPSIKLIHCHKIYIPIHQGCLSFVDPWKHKYVTNVGCTPSKSKASNRFPRGPLRSNGPRELEPEAFEEENVQNSPADLKSNEVELRKKPSSPPPAFEWGWKSSGKLNIFSSNNIKSGDANSNCESHPSNPCWNVRNSISFQDLISNGFEIPEHGNKYGCDTDSSSSASSEGEGDEECYESTDDKRLREAVIAKSVKETKFQNSVDALPPDGALENFDMVTPFDEPTDIPKPSLLGMKNKATGNVKSDLSNGISETKLVPEFSDEDHLEAETGDEDTICGSSLASSSWSFTSLDLETPDQQVLTREVKKLDLENDDDDDDHDIDIDCYAKSNTKQAVLENSEASGDAAETEEVEYDLEWYWDYEEKSWKKCDPNEWNEGDWVDWEAEEEEKEEEEQQEETDGAIRELPVISKNVEIEKSNRSGTIS